MMASNNSDTARYTNRNISPDFKHVYKRLYINVYKHFCLNIYKRL